MRPVPCRERFNGRPSAHAGICDRMTVQQLIDIVVYLKSRYTLPPASVLNEFP
jgi:hypothetical protein